MNPLEIKKFLNKYAIFILVAGVLLFVIAISSINNLPNPHFLYPGESQAKYYTPLRIYRFLRNIGVVITLIGAYFVVQSKYPKGENSWGIDFDGISSSISGSGVGVSTGATKNVQTTIHEIKKKVIGDKEDFVFLDEGGKQVTGINKILNHFSSMGYRIVNTIETKDDSNHEVLQVILEK